MQMQFKPNLFSTLTKKIVENLHILSHQYPFKNPVLWIQ